LPAAGSRAAADGAPFYLGRGDYYSSTQAGPETGYRFGFNETDVSTDLAGLGKSHASTIRCVREINCVENFFLPALGHRFYLDGTLPNQGARGVYWSSTVPSPYGHALDFFVDSSSVASHHQQANAQSIRCVRKSMYGKLFSCQLSASVTSTLANSRFRVFRPTIGHLPSRVALSATCYTAPVAVVGQRATTVRSTASLFVA